MCVSLVLRCHVWLEYFPLGGLLMHSFTHMISTDNYSTHTLPRATLCFARMLSTNGLITLHAYTQAYMLIQRHMCACVHAHTHIHTTHTHTHNTHRYTHSIHTHTHIHTQTHTHTHNRHVYVTSQNLIDRTDVTVILTVYMLPTAMCQETCLCLCVLKTLK